MKHDQGPTKELGTQTFEHLSGYDKYMILKRVASISLDTPVSSEVFRIIMLSRYASLRHMVAQRQNVDYETLEILTHDQDPTVRRTARQNILSAKLKSKVS